MAKVRRLHQRRGWAWTLCILVVKPLLVLLTRRRYVEGTKVPATGGCVVAVNHVSKIDPMALGLFLYEHGRLVRYLAKDSLWRVPVIGPVMTDAGQIPVARSGTDATVAFEAAVRAVEAGELVGLYPEGSITRDPDGWPMRGRTGAARIALRTGAPVVPIGQWGAQDLLPAYAKRPRLLPRATTSYRVGDPVHLDDLRAQPLTNEVLREATDRIMAAITVLVEDLRGETAPATRFDPRVAGVRATGDFTHPRPAPRRPRGRPGPPGPAPSSTRETPESRSP